MLETKVCNECLQSKTLSSFHKRKGAKDGVRNKCGVCVNAHRETLPNSCNHATDLKKNYGITSDYYAELLGHQEGVCAICSQPETAELHGKTKRLAVDHCHTTGKIRGLLCSNCNVALGKMKDDENILYSAIAYLKRST